MGMAGAGNVGCTELGDVDGDRDIDADDVNAYLAGGGVDVNRDGVVDINDRHATIRDVLKTSAGDIDLNYVVNLLDLGQIAAHFGQPGLWMLADGDADGDGDVDILDLGLLANDYGKSFDRMPAAAPYHAPYVPPAPEPAGLGLLAAGGLALIRRRRR